MFAVMNDDHASRLAVSLINQNRNMKPLTLKATHTYRKKKHQKHTSEEDYSGESIYHGATNPEKRYLCYA